MGSTIVHIARGVFICTVFYLLGQFVSRLRSPPVDTTPCVDITTAETLLPSHCYFLDSYFASRDTFIALSKKLQAARIVLPITENLTTDVSVIRGSDQGAVIHLSGTHGVEGYAGSGIQLAILHNMTLHPPPPSSPTYIFVHAVNPYGYSRNRRTNEDNIDLNRNALTAAQFEEVLRRDPNYARHVDLATSLNPATALSTTPLLNDILALTNVAKATLLHGFDAVKQAMVSGNYHNPKGISYGGTSLSTSLSQLFNLLPSLLNEENLSRVVLIDVHTGLGPVGIDTFMSDVSDEILEEHFPIEILHNDSVKHKPKLLGGLKTSSGAGQQVNKGYELTVGYVYKYICDEILRHVSPSNKRCFVQELGTLSPVLVGKAIVEENQATHYGPESQLEFYRQRSRDAFYVNKRSWKHSVVHRGVTVLQQAAAFVMSQNTCSK